MIYLSHIPLHTLDLTPDEEAYLDEQARLDRWINSQPRSSYGLWNAIEDFKDSLYDLVVDHMAAGDNPAHWKELLSRLRNDNKLDVQRAKAFPMEELMRRYGLEPRRGQYSCPFHEDRTPSMSIHKPSNRYKCFACNQSGDSIDFVMKMSKLNFIDAVKRLC